MTNDWKNAVGGNVTEGFVAENLNLNNEYVLQLVETDYQEKVTLTFQGDTTISDRFKTVWQVEGHKTKIWVNFNLPVGYLQGVAGPNERSNVVKFAKRFRAVPKDQPFRLADHFQDQMRIRGYLKKQKDSDFYNLDLDTVGPFNAPPPAPPTASQDRINGLKKLLDLYYPSRDMARKTYLEMPGGNESEFAMIWDMVVAGRVATQAPVIDADKQQQTQNAAKPA